MSLRQTALCALVECAGSRSILTCRARSRRTLNRRTFAVVGTTTYIGNPPAPPTPPPATPVAGASEPNPSSAFDARILSELRRRTQSVEDGVQVPLAQLLEQYSEYNGRVLNTSLPYESRPGKDRRARCEASLGQDDEVVMVVHAAQHGAEHKVTHASGFALHAPAMPDGQHVFVTCTHTLEEIHQSPLLRLAKQASPSHSGSFIISGTSAAPIFSSVTSVLSALHRSDILLVSAHSASLPRVRTLPVSPYPAHPGTAIRAHFVTNRLPAAGPHADGWRPWVGGTWSKWIRGSVLGYRDFAGREAKPGTYDALSHLLFNPPPTAGSSGGPIIDEESGAVIGIMLGTQMQNRLEGMCGWGVPSEMVFEMFTLPGLKLKSSS